MLQKMLNQNPNNLNELLAGRHIDQEFLSKLELVRDYVAEKGSEAACPMTPGAVARNPGDPRINVAKVSDEVIMARTLATIRHSTTGRVFVVYRDTIDAQHMESQDLIKYPKWLMNDQRKQQERSIRINEMLRPPNDKYDRTWLGDLDEKLYDTLAYFLYLQRVH